MKNHSDEKPYHCPRCAYKSKWKWDVVKHLKRCGGGSVKDVVDTTKMRKQEEVRAMLSGVLSPALPSSSQAASSGTNAKLTSTRREVLSSGPPNVTVMPQPADTQSHSMGSPESAAADHEQKSWSSKQAKAHTQETIESVVTDVQNFCVRCPFVGHSPAELKRHTRVHSDEKPFVCQTCGYCSKWKCDLKKHLRTYNHVSAVPLTYGGHGRRPADWPQTSMQMTMKKESDVSLVWEDENIVYGCDQCCYITPKKALLDNHMKVHQDPVIPSDGHLRCRQCNFEAADLSSLIQHKVAHSSPEASTSDRSTASMSSPSKHRRKPQFVMKAANYEGDSESDAGMLERPSDLFSASRSPVPDIEPEKSALLTALGLEVTAKVKQWRQLQQRKKVVTAGAPLPIILDTNWVRSKLLGSSKQVNYRCPHCSYFTDNKTTFEKHVSRHNSSSRYKCEWCTWSANRLNLLYRHAQSVHPHELAQEEKESFYDKVRGRSYSEGSSREGTPTKYNTHGDALDGMVMTDTPGVEPTKTKRKLKSCEKCGYVTDNVTTLNRHVSKHGFDGKFTCKYCDYSVNKCHVIKYHMRTVHRDEGGQPPAKSPMEDYHKGRQTQGETKQNGKGDDESIKSQDPADNNDDDNDETDEYFSEADSDHVSVEVTKVRGQQMKIIQEKGKTTYGCMKCSFSTGNITNGLSHAKQHGAKKKYRCEHCDYSLDQMRYMVHHMKHFHPEVSEDSMSSDGDGSELKPTELLPKTDDGSFSQVMPDRHESEQMLHRRSLVISTGGKPLGLRKCRKCSFFTTSMATFVKHKRYHKIHESKFACEGCGYRASTGRLLQQHIRSHCRFTGQAMASRSNNSSSVAKATACLKNAASSAKSKRRFECTLCPFVTIVPSRMESHMSCHGTDSKYKCEHCTYSVHRADHLQRHKAVHVLSPSKRRSPGSPSKKPLRCSQCPYSTHIQSLLDAHTVTHHSPTKTTLSCHSCDFWAESQELLQKHTCSQPEHNNNTSVQKADVVLPLVNGHQTAETAETK